MAHGHIYMGRRLGRARQGYLLDGRVRGERIPVFKIDGVADPEEDSSSYYPRATLVEKMAEGLTRTEIRLTGGLSPYWGTAVHFSGSRGNFPILFSFEDTRRGDIKEVRYNLDWMHMNPGALARIDTLADGEIRMDGRLVGLTKKREEDARHFVYEWEGQSLESTATSNTYEKEGEMIAFGTDRLNPPPVDGSISILYTASQEPYVSEGLKALGYSQYQANKMSRPTKLEDTAVKMWEKTGREIAERTDEHYLVIGNRDLRTGKRDDTVPREGVEVAVGADGNLTDPSTIPSHLLPLEGSV